MENANFNQLVSFVFGIANARIESEQATMAAINASMQSGMEHFKAVKNNPEFSKWIFNMVFTQTYHPDHDPLHSDLKEVPV